MLHTVFYKHSATEITAWHKIHFTLLFIHAASGIKWLLRHSVQIRSLELLIMKGYGALKLPQGTEGMVIHSAPFSWLSDGS